jgi:hypothetical protein
VRGGKSESIIEAMPCLGRIELSDFGAPGRFPQGPAASCEHRLADPIARTSPRNLFRIARE